MKKWVLLDGVATLDAAARKAERYQKFNRLPTRVRELARTKGKHRFGIYLQITV